VNRAGEQLRSDSTVEPLWADGRERFSRPQPCAASTLIQNRTGSIAEGKEADLVVVRGDVATRIQDLENVETVFSNGVPFDAPACSPRSRADSACSRPQIHHLAVDRCGSSDGFRYVIANGPWLSRQQQSRPSPRRNDASGHRCL
jgi:hypothetical protein